MTTKAIVLLLMMNQLLSQLVLLLLLVERFDNTLLLLFNGFSARALLVDDQFSPGIIMNLIFTRIARSILVLDIVHSHPLALGDLRLLFLV